MDDNLMISTPRNTNRSRKRTLERRTEISTSSTAGERAAPAKKRRKKYDFEKSFGNLASAEKFLEIEMCWSRGSRKLTSDGDTIYYRCNLVKQSGKQCPAKVHLVCKSQSLICLYRAEDEHDHSSKMERRGLPFDVRPAVASLYKAGVEKPTAIAKALAKRGFVKPAARVITNFLKVYKRKEGNMSYEAMPNSALDDEECTVLPPDALRAQQDSPPSSSPLRPYSVAREHPTPTNATSPPASPRKSNQSTYQQGRANSTDDNRSLEREILLMQRETYSKMNEMISEARLAIFEHRLTLRGFDISSCDLQMPPGATLPQQCSE